MSNLKLHQTRVEIESQKQLRLTTKQAADYLGYKVSYLYKLTSSKQIKYCKLNGKRNFFYLRDLEDYLLRGMSELSELDDSDNVNHWKKK